MALPSSKRISHPDNLLLYTEFVAVSSSYIAWVCLFELIKFINIKFYYCKWFSRVVTVFRFFIIA